MGDLAPGTVLGGCRIDAVVGRGGMGVVYRARQLELDRDVALKVIAPELVEDPHTRDRFLAEARAAGAVEHPNVVPVHGVGMAEGRAYLVMRYVAGEDLRSLVRRQGPLSAAHAARVAMQLGNALDAIHRAGYVHRDVKPQNVMLDEAGHVYLSDFGLAKHALSTDGPTRSDQWVGTLDYVAPEQIRGEPVDARADVYALGAVLHFLLTGRVPFERDDDEAKLWAHLVDEPPRLSAARPDLPPALEAVVRRALAKEPAQRHPSAGDLGRAVRAATGGGGDTSRERIVARGAASPEGARRSHPVERATTLPSPPATLVGRSRSPGRRATGAAAAVAVAAAAAAFALLGGDPAEAPQRRPPPPPPPPPAEPRIGDVIKGVGHRPRAVAITPGTAWVVSINRPRITRLDAVSGRRRGVQPVVGLGASSIAAHEGAVWVSMSRGHEVLRLDRRTGETTWRLTTPLRPVLLAAGRSGLWVVGRAAGPGEPDALLHYDREGRELLHRLDVEDGISAITLGRGFLWLSVTRDQPRILRVSPDGQARHAAFVTAPATSLAYGAGYLWASVTQDDSVARVHPRTKLAPTVAAGRRPSQLAVAGGRVFVASFTDHTVVVLDPETRQAIGEPLPVEPNPYAVAADAGHVWVTGVGGNTLTRIDY